MRRFFTRGLAALLPLLLTIFIFYIAVNFLISSIGVPLGEALHWSLTQVGWRTPAPGEGTPWYFHFIGFLLSLLLTLAVGFSVATYLGRKIGSASVRLLTHLPLVRVIYPYTKQLTEFLIPSPERRSLEFKNAVAIPYPHPGLYSVGFITSEGLRFLREATGKHLICVFIPTAPTPFAGYVVFVPREDVIPLPLSAEEALRLVISGGVLTPPHQQVPSSAPGNNPSGQEKGFPMESIPSEGERKG